jgi:cellulose synthase/poly-beta-1,6-N-acetylglucosamine synthase-like glycosyltransferase
VTALDVLAVAEATVLAFFVVLNGSYLLLNLLALRGIRAWVQRWEGEARPWIHTGFEPPISIIVPVHDEEATAAASIRSLLNLEYPDYEIVVVNDGSTDGTMDVLVREFGLVRFPEVYRDRIRTRPVRGIYRSSRYSRIRVVDKENGRKADAVNAGLNVARHGLVLIVDGDSFLQRDSLLRVVQPFQDDPRTIACGGTVRIANGCRAEEGYLTEIRLPDNWPARFQVVEYLRAFLFGRMGWAPLRALCIISGAFGLFDREVLLRVGGLRHDTLGEDMELTVRLHRHFLLVERRPYRIQFLPDPICWTEAPESLRDLASQRTRWTRGLSEVLWYHRVLLFHPRGGAVSWLALPFFLLFEWLSAPLELFGYLFIVGAAAFGILSLEGFLAFLGVAVGSGIVLSLSSILLEEMSFRLYPRRRDLLLLVATAVLENFGYRQLHAWWRCRGILQSLLRRRATWQSMTRKADWARKT